MRVKNDYFLNKVEYPKTVTAVQSLLLNCQPNYSRKYQSQGSNNRLIFNQCEKLGMVKVKQKVKINCPGGTLTTSLAMIMV